MNKYRLYWKDGKTEVVEGNTLGAAMSSVGYGHGALKALDFHTHGVEERYYYIPETHSWKEKYVIEETLSEEEHLRDYVSKNALPDH